MDKAKLLHALQNEHQLLANPLVFSQMLEALDDPEITLQEVAEIISRDQTTVANILRLVNSAAYGLPRKVNRMDEALTLLGLNTVMSLVLSTGLMNNPKLQAQDLSDFWLHTIATSVASQFWAHCLDLSDEQYEISMTLGLIHDIGRLWLWQTMPEVYYPITQSPEYAEDQLKTESLTLGLNHAEIGRELARLWNWPKLYQDVIGNHHHPALSQEDPFLSLSVFLGNRSAHIAFPSVPSDRDFDFPYYLDTNKSLLTPEQRKGIYPEDWEDSLSFLEERQEVMDAFLQIGKRP